MSSFAPHFLKEGKQKVVPTSRAVAPVLLDILHATTNTQSASLSTLVAPAKAGAQRSPWLVAQSKGGSWIPAFAGMTRRWEGDGG